MHHCSKFILFWNDTLHVSDGLSIHHQEFKTVHTATGICQTDTAVCLLAGIWDIGAFSWFYYRNILRCAAVWTSNIKQCKWQLWCILKQTFLIYAVVIEIFTHSFNRSEVNAQWRGHTLSWKWGDCIWIKLGTYILFHLI